MNRGASWLRWLMIVGVAGFLPAFILNCDKAALNLQRGFLLGLGEDVAGLVMEQVQIDGDEES